MLKKNKREMVMKAHVFDPKIRIEGWYLSEKMDGMRALWDSGISRGLPCVQIPWANTEKHGRYRDERIATGLWTTYGQPIYAPNWWLDQLPRNVCLDGELWMGRNAFQSTMSVVKRLEANQRETDWHEIVYWVFDIPMLSRICWKGLINNPNMKKEITQEAYDWAMGRWEETGRVRPHNLCQFKDVYAYLKSGAVDQDNIKYLGQRQVREIDEVWELLEEVTNGGGEGVMLRAGYSIWTPERSWELLKVKKLLDSEGQVVGYTSGRETDKGSKLLGKMGALILMWRGKTFEISGFTDTERELTGTHEQGWSAEEYAKYHPGEAMPMWITNEQFPRGSKVTFRYRELTDAGIPKEGRYWRKA